MCRLKPEVYIYKPGHILTGSSTEMGSSKSKLAVLKFIITCGQRKEKRKREGERGRMGREEREKERGEKERGGESQDIYRIFAKI